MTEGTKELVGIESGLVSAARADQNPAAVYLARLSPGSRRAMRQALDVVAGIEPGATGRGVVPLGAGPLPACAGGSVRA